MADNWDFRGPGFCAASIETMLPSATHTAAITDPQARIVITVSTSLDFVDDLPNLVDLPGRLGDVRSCIETGRNVGRGHRGFERFAGHRIERRAPPYLFQ